MKKVMFILTFVCTILCGVANVNSDEIKVLTLREGDGGFEYSLDENKFMDFEDMIPGGTYHDNFGVINECKDKEFDVYFQIIPVEQSSIADELLEHISMKITYGDEVLYTGRATGKSYSVGEKNLQNQILLGTYKPREGKNLDVIIRLDDEIDKELTGITSRIDWEFTIVYDDIPKPVNPPKTGDNTDMIGYLVMGAASISVILLMVLLINKRKEK